LKKMTKIENIIEKWVIYIVHFHGWDSKREPLHRQASSLLFPNGRSQVAFFEAFFMKFLRIVSEFFLCTPIEKFTMK
jgi:hypothetical protein